MSGPDTYHFHSPIGTLEAVFSDYGLYSLEFLKREEDDIIGKGSVEDNRWGGLRTFLEDFFEGSLEKTDIILDTRRLTDFQSRVYKELRKIRFGELVTYGELARRIGAPHASRAIGGAMGRNPYVLIVPCHRVVAWGERANSIGGFSAVMGRKRYLLRLEGHGSDIRGL